MGILCGTWPVVLTNLFCKEKVDFCINFYTLLNMKFSYLDFFSSKAKIRALETLSSQVAPIPLRRLEALSETPIRSVVLALRSLEKEKVVFKKKQKHHTLYALNPTHRDYIPLTSIMRLATEAALQSRAKNYQKKAKLILAFQNSAKSLIGRGRESIHD